MPLVDLWLFDFKETDRQSAREVHVGKPQDLILANLRQLHDAGAKIIVRCPLIPEHNARPEHLDGIVALSRRLPQSEGSRVASLLSTSGGPSSTRFGLKTELPDTVKPPSRETVKSWNDYLRDRGVRVVA